MNVSKVERGRAAAHTANRREPLSLLVRAESDSHGPASVGFGYERDAWQPAVTSRSLSAEVLSHGIAGSVIA